MKFLCAILALLVLTLSAQPVCIAATASSGNCCADSHCADGTEQDEEDEAGACDQCNPFQLCGCCAFSAVPVAQLSIHPAERAVYSACRWSIPACPAIEEPVLGFWQPPKLTA
ncbi:MAG: hypothetical protein JNL13_07100 [Chitinophagaceae bacterium]|nr:hypothetical protein [Chitinophagaceae bacterium]